MNLKVLAKLSDLRHDALQNRMLAGLPNEVLEAVRQRAVRVGLTPGQTLFEAGDTADYVFFVSSGLVSIVPRAEPGPGPRRASHLSPHSSPNAAPHLAMVGREAAAGLLEVMLGAREAMAGAVVQVGGAAVRIGSDWLRHVMASHPALLEAGQEAARDMIGQLMATSVSVMSDKLLRRCARWLVMAQERVEEDAILVTHDTLAAALGVRRTGVTLALSQLEAAGLVHAGRGRIEVTDPEGLRRVAEGRVPGPPPILLSADGHAAL